MNTKNNHNLKMLVGTMLLLLVTESIQIIPWWSFVVTLILFGIYAKFKNLSIYPFRIGFIAGLLGWLGALCYFDLRSNAILLYKLAMLFVWPLPVIFLVTGVIGGILTGLSLFTGYQVLNTENSLKN